MESPKKAKRALDISREAVDRYQKKVKLLNQTIRRANKKIKSLQALVAHLEEKDLIKSDVATLIKV